MTRHLYIRHIRAHAHVHEPHTRTPTHRTRIPTCVLSYFPSSSLSSLFFPILPPRPLSYLLPPLLTSDTTEPDSPTLCDAPTPASGKWSARCGRAHTHLILYLSSTHHSTHTHTHTLLSSGFIRIHTCCALAFSHTIGLASLARCVGVDDARCTDARHSQRLLLPRLLPSSPLDSDTLMMLEFEFRLERVRTVGLERVPRTLPTAGLGASLARSSVHRAYVLVHAVHCSTCRRRRAAPIARRRAHRRVRDRRRRPQRARHQHLHPLRVQPLPCC
jgi:hypothetical protein